MNKFLAISYKSITGGIMIVTALAFSSLASATHKHRHFDYARVTNARPIYETVTRRIPVQECRVETVRVDHHGNDGATLVGGLIGAAIGHNLGHGRNHQGARTVAGAIIGASIANSATRTDRPHSEYRDIRRCDTHYEIERFDELVGYEVTYRYHGKTYFTRTDSHPGDRIRVAVSVRTAF